jgi:hypothetical protein
MPWLAPEHKGTMTIDIDNLREAELIDLQPQDCRATANSSTMRAHATMSNYR